jgi:hypothetical protein
MASINSLICPLYHPPRFSRNTSMVVRLRLNSMTDLFRNLKTEVLFENDYICVSVMENQINLEIPLDTLHRALKSCSTSSETTIRLTKKDNNAYLALSTSIIVHNTAYSTLIVGKRRKYNHPSGSYQRPRSRQSSKRKRTNITC